MARIKSLYDAIIKTKIEEDQCTNFLVWLLEKLPPKTILGICKISGLSIDEAEIIVNRVQFPLENSRPDALIEFLEGKYIIVETKRFPNRFEKEQFVNHFKGGCKEFGEENIWLLFLSGDEYIPDELDEFKGKHDGRIGFLSWKSLLCYIEENEKSIDEKYEIIIEEFKTFAKHYKLGRLKYMNNEEMKKFIETYPLIGKNQYVVEERFNKIINEMQKYIIAECEESVEENGDDIYEQLPCLYKCLKIKYWHTNYSGYIFLNILLKNIGIILTGYSNEKEKRVFLELWNEQFKNKYKNDLKLCSLTWISEDDDDAINNGYFKIVEGTSGKIFSPDKIAELADDFFWGYVYDLELENIQKSYYENVAKDFKKLLDTFRNNNDIKSHQTAGKKRR